MDLSASAGSVTAFASTGVETILALVGGFLALIVLSVVFLALSYRAKGGLPAIIVALYAGYGLYVVFPFSALVIKLGATPVMQAALSIALYASLTFVPYVIVGRLAAGKFGGLALPLRLGLAVLAAGSMLALAYQVFDAQAIYTLPSALERLFAEDYFFYWFIAPLVALLLLVR